MINILRREPYERLVRLLDLAVTMDPTVADSRHTILAPLRMLDALAREIPGALGADRQALERLRLLVTLSAAYTPPTSILGDLGNLTLDARAARSSSGTGGTSLEPHAACSSNETVIHLGALVLVGLAAARLGAEIGLAQPFIQQVHGLAVAAGPAEALARAAASGLDGSQASAVLTVFMPGRNGDRHLSAAIGAFLSDPCERARWRCLHDLFQAVQSDTKDLHWETSRPVLVSRVEPPTACPGQEIIATISSARDSADDVATAFTELAAGRLTFMFANADGAPLFVQPFSTQPSAGTAHLRVPLNLNGPGWVGLATIPMNPGTSLKQLRQRWLERNAAADCLRRDPVPVDLIPIAIAVTTPARHYGAEITGGSPRVMEFSILPSPLDTTAPATVRWRVEGATSVSIDAIGPGLKSEGVQEIVVPVGAAEVAVALRAVSACDRDVVQQVRNRVRGRITDITVRSLSAHSQVRVGDTAEILVRVSPPRYGGRCEVIIGEGTPLNATSRAPGFTVEIKPDSRAISGRVRLIWNDGFIDAEESFGPFDVDAPLQQRIFFIRPAAVPDGDGEGEDSAVFRSSLEEAHRAIERAAAETEQSVAAREPSWVDDVDLELSAAPDGPTHDATRAMLARLHRLAARHVGTEDAIWLALLPDTDDRAPWNAWEPSEVAARVGVSTLGALTALLREPLGSLPAPTDCLRLIGTIDASDKVVLEEVVWERRSAWPATGKPVGAQVTLFDSAAVVTDEFMLRSADRTPLRHIVMLCPSPATTHVVEIRLARARGRAGAATRRERPLGSSRFSRDRMRGALLSWRHHHTGGARVRQCVDIAVGGVWSPWFTVPDCERRADLPVARVTAGDQPVEVRVRAYDGWHMVMGKPHLLNVPGGDSVVLRLARGASAWADTREPVNVRWMFGDTLRAGTVLRLPSGFEGELAVEAEDGGGRRDQVVVPAPPSVRQTRRTRSMPGYDD